MRKTALRKKGLVSIAIFAVAVFPFFSSPKNAFADTYEDITESFNISGGFADGQDFSIFRYLPTDSVSIDDFQIISQDATTGATTIKFSLKTKPGVNGAELSESNEIKNLFGWDPLFEIGPSKTVFETDSGKTSLNKGQGLYLDIALNKTVLGDFFINKGSDTDSDYLYFTPYQTGSGETFSEKYIKENNVLGENTDSLLGVIKNTEIVKFGTATDEAISKTEKTFPISPTTGQVSLNTEADVDTIVWTGTVSNLYPGETYYAQIRLEEDMSSGEKYPHTLFSTKILQFTIPSTAPKPTEETTIETTTINGASVVENDSNWLTADLNCGIKIFAWQSENTSLLDCIPLALYKFVYVPSAAILYFAGSMMDVFFGWTISSSIYRDSTFVVDGWRIVRDLCNICFILALVFAAVQAILQMGGSIRRTVVSVIIIGLLINFSLFFSRVVIDAGNALARVFYNQITISGVSSGVAITSSDIEFKPLSQAIMDGMNIQKVISSDVLGAVRNAGWSSYSDEAAVTIIVILGIFLNVTAAWAFFLISWTFVGRIVGLWLAMIVSPIPFISRVVPRMGTLIGNNSMGAWFSNLLTLSFMAPIFIFLMYLLIFMLESGFLSSLIKF